jgi:hypothetical protein
MPETKEPTIRELQAAVEGLAVKLSRQRPNRPQAKSTTIVNQTGGPTFIEPVSISTSTSTSAWATFDCTEHVPDTAKAVILDCTLQGGTGGGSTDNSQIRVRIDANGDAYVVNKIWTDNDGGANQGIYPLLATPQVRSFQWEHTSTFSTGTVTFNLIGYIE